VAGTGKGLASNEVYTLQMKLNYISHSPMDVIVSWLDAASNVIASVMASDTENIVTSFDAFMYRASNGASMGGMHTIARFSVTAIPEPSTYAALFGVAALGLVAYRRHRAAHAA